MADPFSNELSALRQIDFDLIYWSQAVVANLQAWAALSTSGVMRMQVDFIDCSLSSILAAIQNPVPAGPKPITALTLTNPSVDVTDSPIAAANSSRKFLLVSNQSAIDVYINFGTPAVPYYGLLVGAGGFWATGDTGPSIYTGAVSGITVSAPTFLTVVEG